MAELSLLLCYAFSYLILWTTSSLIARRLCGHKGQPSPILDIIALVNLASAGYVAFWIYVMSPKLGALFSVLFLFGGWLWAILSYRHRLTQLVELFSRPVRVTFLFGLLYLSGMSLFGGVEKTPTWFVPEIGVDPPSAVFGIQPRAIDSLIPVKFAYAVAHQNHLLDDINFGVWRFSDRPPVQAGSLLLCWPLTKLFGVGVVNLAIGVLVQVQWVLAVFAVTWALGWGRARTTFIVLAIGTSGFVYFSSVYVWPKLLAAALWLAASAPLIRVWRQRRAPTPNETVLAASGCALAFLAHGGIGFSLLPAGFLALFYRPFRSWRFWLPGIVVALVFYVPWMGYQKFIDPPGDRCLKMMFAGYAEGNDQHWIASTVDAYKRLGWAKFLGRQKENFGFLFGDHHLDHNIVECVTGMIDPQSALADAKHGFRTRYYAERSLLGYDMATLAALLRYDQVEQTFRALGFLNLAWPILIWAVLRSRWKYMRRRALDLLVLHTGLTLLVWWLLIFRSGHLLIRHGSFGMMLSLLMIAASVIYDAPKAVRYSIFCFHLIFNVVLWVVFVPTDFARQYLHLQSLPCPAPLFGAVLAIVGIVYFSVAGKLTDWWGDVTVSVDVSAIDATAAGVSGPG